VDKYNQTEEHKDEEDQGNIIKKISTSTNSSTQKSSQNSTATTGDINRRDTDDEPMRCNVCLSQHHTIDKCSVAWGEISATQAQEEPETCSEIIRLHELHKSGEYNPYQTETTLRSILDGRIELIEAQKKTYRVEEMMYTHDKRTPSKNDNNIHRTE